MTEDENMRPKEYSGLHPDLYVPEEDLDIDQREEEQPERETRVSSEIHHLYTSLRDGTFFNDPMGSIFQDAAQLPADERKRYILNKLDVLSYRTEEAKLLESIEAAAVSVEKIQTRLKELLALVDNDAKLKRTQKNQLKNKISAISDMLDDHLKRARASAPLYESFVEAIRAVIERTRIEKVEDSDISRFAQSWASIRSLFTGQSAVASVAAASIAFSSLSPFASQEAEQPAWMHHLAEANDVATVPTTLEDKISHILGSIIVELNALKPLVSTAIDTSPQSIGHQLQAYGLNGTLSAEIINTFKEQTTDLKNTAPSVETEEQVREVDQLKMVPEIGSQVEQANQTEIPESILNIPIKFVSLGGGEVDSGLTLGQVAAEAGVDLSSVVQSFGILNEWGLPVEVLANGANLKLIIMAPQGETPTMEQLVESLTNHRFLHFELRNPVNASDGFLHERENLVFTSAGEAPMYISRGQFFTELRKVQAEEGIDTFSTTRENSELVPDYKDEIVRLIDTTTQQTTVIFDIKALREQRGTYGPGVINILNGNGYGNILRSPAGEITAVVTPEGVEIPFQTEGSVRIAKREIVEMTSALRDAMNASRPAGTESSEIFVLEYDYYLSTRLDNPSAPRYKWVNEGWQDQHLGRDKYDAILPGGNISLLTRQFGDRIIGWNQEVMGYERNDGKIFYPGLGTTEQNGSYDASDLEDGWVTITELVQSSNYVPGESGLKLVFSVAENHSIFGSIRFDDRLQQEQIDIVVSWILEQFPRMNGWTLNAQLLADDVSSQRGFNREGILDINARDIQASGETSIVENHTLLSRLSPTLNDVERRHPWFGWHFFGSLLYSVDEYVSRTERWRKFPMDELQAKIEESLKAEPFTFMVSERK